MGDGYRAMLENFQFSQPPFSFLTTPQKQFLRTRLNTCRYLQGERIALLERDVPVVYLIVEGHVEKRGLKDQKILQKYGKDDVLVLPANRSLNQQKYEFYVTENLRCYQLRDEAFQQLCLENPAFSSWFSQGDTSDALSLNFSHSASFILAPISEESFSQLCYISPEASIQEAALYMHEHDLKTLLIAFENGSEGLLTLSDLLWALTIEEYSLDTQVACLVKKDLHVVDYNGLLFHAMLTMAKNQEQRIVVKEDGQTKGLIELPILMHKFFPNAPSFAFQVQEAHDLEQLQQCSAAVYQYLGRLSMHRLSFTYLMPIAQVLHDSILHKAFELSFPQELAEQICLIVMGSEGRGERILACEPAHALIIDDQLDNPHFIKYCREFHHILTHLNYCFGEKTISLMDPEWVKPIGKWQQNVNFWSQNFSAQARHHIGLIQDARAIAGKLCYLDQLQQYLLDPHKAYPDLIDQQFSDIADQETPLTVLGGIKASSDGLDLQETGLKPLLSGLRSLSLLHHLPARSTFDRIEQLSALKAIESTFADEIKQAFELFLSFDLQIRVHQDNPSQRVTLNPDRISKHERDKLRMAYHTIRQFKQWLRLQRVSSSAS